MAAKASAEITLTYLIDIKATYRYYRLQSSTLATPSKPTTNPPASPWTDSEPEYTSGSTSSLYYVDLTVFSNDTFLYSNVSLSTSYEAAKEAFNKAQNAQNTANNAQNTANNAQASANNAQNTANNAEKVATNFMQHDSTNGLLIGDKTNGSWSGYRTQVKTDSFNVLDENGSVLSTFGANKIELGKNNEDSQILMCNGLGKIHVDVRPDNPSYNSVYFSADTLSLRGSNLYMFSDNRERFDPPGNVDGVDVAMVERFGTVKAQPDSFKLSSVKTLWDTYMQYVGAIETEIRGETGKLTLFATDGIKLDGELKDGIRPEWISVYTAGTTDTLLQEVYADLPNRSVHTICLDQSVQDSLPVGGTWFVTMYKTNDTYGIIKAIRYYSTTAPYTVEYQRGIYGGTWSPWEQVGLLPTETGTWTPRINAGTITSQYCTYQKVNNMCTISFEVEGTGAAASSTNTHFYITGAPYTPSSSARWYGGCLHVQGLKVPSGFYVTGSIIQSSNSAIYLRTCQSNADAPEGGYVCANNGKAKFYLSGSITYPVEELFSEKG